jgi:hypothetical protein
MNNIWHPTYVWRSLKFFVNMSIPSLGCCIKQKCTMKFLNLCINNNPQAHLCYYTCTNNNQHQKKIHFFLEKTTNNQNKFKINKPSKWVIIFFKKPFGFHELLFCSIIVFQMLKKNLRFWGLMHIQDNHH